MEEVSFASVNWLAIIGATIAAFLIGGIWYGPLFAKAWMNAGNFTEEVLKGRNMGKVFGLSLLMMFIASVNLEMFIGPQGTASYGAIAGLLAGFGWVATFLGVIYLFEKRSGKLFFINAGYCIVTLTIMGAILGNW